MRLEGKPVEVLQTLILAGATPGYWVVRIARALGHDIEIVETVGEDKNTHYRINHPAAVETWDFRRDPEVLNAAARWIESADETQLKEVARILAMATSCTISYVDDEHIIVDNFSPVYTL
ncbi:MAG: hypothetical protein KatS3mg023_3858 [Armatimonadota bacterium]|nr:MAG: hypothetical protein KatS3mg023_3858 [Armatimonadota bacterium]